MVAIKRPRRKIKKVTENTEVIIEENVLSLRQKRKLVDVDWTRVRGFYKEHHNGMFASISVVLIFSIIFVFSINTHALVTNFYSNSCLGGWENPANTQGEPNAIGSTESNNLFSKKNSAFLNKTNGEIFCGDFKGETPESTRPNKATVKLSLFITDKELPEKEESAQEKVDGILNDTSETPIENNTVPVEVEKAEEEPVDVVDPIIDPVIESIIPTEIPIEENNEIKGETTLLNKFFPTVYAQEETPIVEPSVPVEPAVVEIAPPPIPPVPSEIIQSENIPTETIAVETEAIEISTVDSGSTLSTEIAPVLSESDIVESTPLPLPEIVPDLIIDPVTTVAQEENKRANDVLEVIYSFDGVDWKTLGTINRETFTDISFDLPILELDWNVISKLQISVRTIPTIDVAPVFYLDSVYLAVEYEGDNEPVVEPPTISLIDPELSLLSGDLDFSGDEDVVFTVTDPNFTNKELRNLADENKIEIIKDDHNFFNKEEESSSISTFPDVTTEAVKVIETPLNMSGPSGAVESIKNLVNPEEVKDVSTPIEIPIENNIPKVIEETIETPNVDKDINGIPSEIIPDQTIEVIPAENIVPVESTEPQARIFNSIKSDFSYEKIITLNYFRNSFNLPIKAEKIGDLPRLGLVPYVFAEESIADFKDTVTAEVFDPNGKLSDVTISIQTVIVDGEEKAEVHISRPSHQFKPGKYSVKVTLQKTNATIVSEQDFTWGVLTINVDKSIYAPGEKAYLQMGVLNEYGHTLCMADLNLEIKSSGGNITNFSSDLPTPLGQQPIVRDPECGPDNVISVPDYYAYYDIPTELGLYEMTLTATTANGDKTIHDTFVVSDNQIFDVGRVGPTRIYPVANYPVQIKIKSVSDWSGVVQEYAPESFDILHPTVGKDYDNITTFNNLKIISWNVELKAGEEIVLGYLFDAPNVSPEMFLLGKIKFFEFIGGTQTPQLAFQESRKWQIASDGVNRYWVGGTGTWDSSATTHWSASSGGASGASAPTSVDNVFIDGNSGAGTITPSGAITMLDLDFTGYTGTFTPAGTITVSGSINIASGMTLTSVAQGWTLNATDSRTLTFNGKSMGSGFFTFNGVGGTWTLQDAWTSTANNTLTNGTLDTNGKTVTIASLQSNNANTRGLTLGSSTINLTTSGGVWNVRTTGLTFDAGTSTINCTSTSAIQFGVSSTYPMTFYDVNFTAVGATVNLIAAHTYHNLTLTQTTTKTGAVTLTANQTVTNLFTANGNSAANRLFVRSDTSGTVRTITSASVSISNADFLDITGAGAGSPFTGTSVGSCGNNTNITGDTATTRYWVGGTGNWADTSEWSASSGGASGATAPLCHDSVIFNASSFSAGSQTVTVNMARLGKDINVTGITNTPTFSFGSNANMIFGSVTLVSGMTISGSQILTLAPRSSVNFTSGTKILTMPVTIDAGGGGSVVLQDAFDNSGTTANTLTLTSGTFDANNQNVKSTQFSSTNTNVRTLTMGSGTWTFNGGGTFTLWDTLTVTNMTLNANTSTIKFSEGTGSANAKSFSGGGLTYNNVWFTTASSGSSTYILTVLGSNTFNDFKWDRTDLTATNYIKFTAGITTTVNTFTVSGVDATHMVKIDSTTTATHNLVKLGGGTINRDYLNIQHSVASPASTWYAGANSTNNQATATAGSGWTFTAAPTACVATGTGTWGGTDTANFTGCTGSASGGSGTGARPGTGDALTINSGVTVTLSTNTPVLGVLTIDGTLDTSGTNYSLSSINININSTGALTANASTITVSATSGVAFYKHSSGTFTYGTSTVTFTGDGAFTSPNFITSSNATAFYNLTFSPTLSTARTYTFGNGAITVNGNFDSNPSGGGSARALTTMLGSGGMTIVGTFTLQGTSSGTSTFDTGTGLNYALTFSTVNITSSDTLNTRGSTVNITGTSGTLITNSGTWTTPVTPSVTTLSGNGSATINTAALTFFNLTSSGTGTKTLAASITTTVSNVLTVSSGTFALGTSSTLTLSGTTGTPFVCSATCSGGTGIIQYTGAYASGNTTIDSTGVTYYSLTLNASDTFVLDGDLTGSASGTLTITTGTLDTTASNFAINIGLISIANSASAILTVNDSTISLLGTSGTLLTRGASGVFNYGTSLVDLTGNGSATITSATVTFYDLRSSGTGTKTMSSALTINNNLTINAGSFEPGVITATGSGTNVLSVASGATLNAGSSTFAGNYSSFETITLSSGSTVDYNRASAQTVDSTLSYSNLTFSGSGGTKSMNGTTTATGTVNISAGNTLDAVSGSNYNLNAYYFTMSAGVYNMQQSTLTLSGTSGTLFTKSGGTFTVGSSSTVVMNPDSSSTLTSGTITFNNLTLSPTITTGRTYTFGASALTINGDFTINPTASSAYALLVNLGASTTVAATKTTIITRTTSATSELNTTSGGSYAFSSGKWSIQTGGTLTANASALTLTATSGTLITFAGSFSGGTSTLTLNGGTSTINSASMTGANALCNLTLNLTAATFSLGANLEATGLTTITLGTLDTDITNNYTFTTGSMSISNTASAIFNARASTVNLSGTSGTLFTRATSGVFTYGTSTVILTGNGNATLNSGTLTFYNLSQTGTGVKTVGAAITINNNFTVSGGTFDPTASYTITGSGTNILTGNSGGTLRVGASTFAGNYSSFETRTLNSGSTVDYYVNGAQTVDSTLSYANLSISVGNTKSLNGTTTATGATTIDTATLDTVNGSNYALNSDTLVIQNSGTLRARNSTITLTGTGSPVFTNSANFVADTSNLKFTGDGAPTLFSGTFTGASAPYDLELAPVLGADRTYSGGAAVSPTHNFTIDPSSGVSSRTLTYNLGGNNTITGTLLVQPGAISVNAIVDTTSGGNYSLSAGNIDLQTRATLVGNASTITLTGTTGTLFSLTGTGAFSYGTSTVVFNPNASATLTSGAITFYNLSLTPTITADRTYTFGTSTLTVNGDFNINPTASSGFVLYVNPGADISVASTKTTTITGTTSALSTLDLRPFSTDYNLTTGFINIGTTGTLDATSGAPSITVNGTTGTLFTSTGTFSAGNSTTIMNGNASLTLTSGTITFYNLNLTPTITTGRTYTFGGGTTTINGDFNLNPTASSTLLLTVNMGGTITQAALKSTTITGTTSGTSKLDTISGSNYTLNVGSMIINSAGTLIANNSNITVGKNWSNAGTFTAGNSTVTLNTGTTSTVDSGPTTFYNLTITHTTAKQVNFSDNASHIIHVTGAFTITGNVAGLITLNSTSPGNQWHLHPTGTASADYVTVQDGGCESGYIVIYPTHSNNGLNNGPCWVFPVDVSGTVFMSDETTQATTGNGGFCDGSTQNLTLRVNGTNPITTFCDVSTGDFSFGNNVTAIADDVITIYSTDASQKANRVYLSDGTADGGIGVYIDVVSVSYFENGPVDMADLAIYDSTTNATDMMYDATVAPDTLTVDTDKELHVESGSDFTPGGDVTASRLHVIGTYNAGSDTITLTGTSGTLLTVDGAGTFNYGTSTVIMNPDSDTILTLGNVSFYDLDLIPIITGDRAYIFGSGGISVYNNFEINPTAGTSSVLNVSLGDTTTVVGMTTITGTTSGASVLDTTGSNFRLYSGSIDITSTGTLNANGSDIGLTGISGILFTIVGTFNYGTSNVIVTGDASMTLVSGTTTFYNLSFAPTITANRTYTIGSSTVTVNNEFIMATTASSAYTLLANMGNSITVLGTTTIAGLGSGISELDTTGSNYSFTSGDLVLMDAGVFTANDSNITLNDALSLGNPLFDFQTGATFNYDTSKVIVNVDNDESLTNGLVEFYELELSPIITDNRIYTFGAGDVTIHGDFNIIPDLSSGKDFYTNLGGILVVDPTGLTNISPTGSAGSAFLDTTPDNHSLTSGKITIDNAFANLVANASVVTITGDDVPYKNNGGSLNYGTSQFVFNNSAGAGLVPIYDSTGSVSFYDLEFSPFGPGGYSDSYYTLGTETINVDNDFSVAGSYPYVDAGGLQVTMDGDINVGGDLDITFSGLNLSSLFFNNAILTVDGNVDVTSTGVLSSVGTTGDLVIGGNFTINGAFDAGLSTVTLTSSTTSIIAASSNIPFYNLTISNATAKQVQFPIGGSAIIDVTNDFVVTGHTAQLIDLYSTSSGTKWHFNPTGTQTVDYARVRDGGCEVTADIITPTNSTDQGNNEFCWNMTKTITFESSDNSVGFGTISTSSSRYADGTGTGSSTEVEAHNFSVATNATGGYSITVFGATLSRVGGGDSITAIGNTNTAPSAGVEQFGLRAVATGGSGSVNTPYDGSGFAYNGVSSPSQVGSAISGDGVATNYSIRYLGNIANNTSAGEYTTTLTYIVTGTF